MAEEFLYEDPIRHVAVKRPLTEETFSAPSLSLLRLRSPLNVMRSPSNVLKNEILIFYFFQISQFHDKSEKKNQE